MKKYVELFFKPIDILHSGIIYLFAILSIFSNTFSWIIFPEQVNIKNPIFCFQLIGIACLFLFAINAILRNINVCKTFSHFFYEVALRLFLFCIPLQILFLYDFIMITTINVIFAIFLMYLLSKRTFFMMWFILVSFFIILLQEYTISSREICVRFIYYYVLFNIVTLVVVLSHNYYVRSQTTALLAYNIKLHTKHLVSSINKKINIMSEIVEDLRTPILNVLNISLELKNKAGYIQENVKKDLTSMLDLNDQSISKIFDRFSILSRNHNSNYKEYDIEIIIKNVIKKHTSCLIQLEIDKSFKEKYVSCDYCIITDVLTKLLQIFRNNSDKVAIKLTNTGRFIKIILHTSSPVYKGTKDMNASMDFVSAKNMIKMHGGDLWQISDKNKMLIAFTLPIREDDALAIYDTNYVKA